MDEFIKITRFDLFKIGREVDLTQLNSEPSKLKHSKLADVYLPNNDSRSVKMIFSYEKYLVET